ncbi:hypothetical protein [Actinoplanes couchii]|uniref:hypothetical protein n=1 Tax=Actinoplanes couchii TaxID=403638 RepID=UPI0019441A9E|nr:hypothetical protein [Actinoplanes couchii]MDR6321503.1 hypothetical protein [Actinoplanes couchii]
MLDEKLRRRGVTPVLGPDGLGGLKLGTPMAVAVESGLLAVDSLSAARMVCNDEYKVAAAGSAESPVVFDIHRVLVSLVAFPGVATPEGDGLGSSVTAVRKAYPDLQMVPESDFGAASGGSWGFVSVPGNDRAGYYFGVLDDRVARIKLQLDRTDCHPMM